VHGGGKDGEREEGGGIGGEAREFQIMTLIVAMANSDIGFMIGDTILTPLLEVKGNPTGPVNGEFHGLKIQILNGKTAIAFASSNASGAALDIIAEVARCLQQNPQMDIFEAVFDTYSKKLSGVEKPDCEFLVLRLEVNGKRLALVNERGVEFRERAYIGDADQYKKMTELRTPYQGPTEQHVQQPDGSFKIEKMIDSEGQIEFMEVGFAVQRLVEQRKHEGVGAISGNVIRVVDARISGELEYLQTHEASVGPAEGQSGFSLLASNSGVRGVAIYYVAGKVGFLLIVGDSEMCRRETGGTLESFKQIAKQKYGLELT
jgi:hypothetical protein